MAKAVKGSGASRKAGSPHQERPKLVSLPLRDMPWRSAAVSAGRRMGRDHMGLIAAGVAFYMLVSLVPLLIAAVSAYGLIADPAAVEGQVLRFAGVLPAEARSMLENQLNAIVSNSSSSLTWGVVLSLMATLWAGSKMSRAIIEGINIAYEETDDRSFLSRVGLGLLFTLALIGGIIIAVVIVGFLPVFMNFLPGNTSTLVAIGSWLLMAVGVLLLIGSLYRYAPDCPALRAAWVTPGSLIAALVWFVASLGFSFYVANFGNYNETYGSLGGVIIMLLWMYLSAYILLLGAEFNAALAKQARKGRVLAIAPRET